MALLQTTGKILKEFFSEFTAHKVPKLAAALAYYTVFSLPALIILVIWLSDIFYGHDAVEGKVYIQLVDLIGKQGALQIQQTIRNTALSGDSHFATIAGIISLLVGATGIFTEMQDSINQVWHLKSKPRKGKGLLKMLINRLLSFSMIAVLGFLLLVSLLVNSVMDIFLEKFARVFPDMQVIVIYIFNFIFTFFVTSFLFAVIFKVLPDAKIKWRDVRPGVIVTALLFMGGKFLISYYLGQSNISSSYGAAGSVIIILLWVYFSAIILFIGAIFTRTYILFRGSNIYPNNYAVWIEKSESETNKPFTDQAEKI
ncbi:MAG: YihY/virulence factor BrkB family protein [Bacteroidota bacterium]